ncbi:MAG: GDSL family lipase, partial [Gemmatimonadota bacterium]|nr:GDSL family lipase [Gemmatimonadota bacterium]
MSQYWIEDGQTLLFIGDSITDCGRRGAEAPLGNGYVRLFTELATARFSERRVRYINKGIGGNRVTDLADR